MSNLVRLRETVRRRTRVAALPTSPGDSDEPDVEIVARMRANKLRFDAEPEVEVRFPGNGERDSRQVTTRENIDKPVEPGRTYRRVFVATRISSRLVDEDGSG